MKHINIESLDAVKETITSIKEVYEVTIEDQYGSYEGWEIQTTLRNIKIYVNDQQSCCETFGSIVSEDNVESFIGSDLSKVEVVDVACSVKMLEDIGSLDAGDTMFVNFTTSKGLLQFAVYNSHNGYYGHDAKFIVDDIILHEKCI